MSSSMWRRTVAYPGPFQISATDPSITLPGGFVFHMSGRAWIASPSDRTVSWRHSRVQCGRPESQRTQEQRRSGGEGGGGSRGSSGTDSRAGHRLRADPGKGGNPSPGEGGLRPRREAL